MKKSHHILSICVLSCSMVFAQEGRSFPPRGAAGPSAESASDQARRGIEKKDIRRGMVIARSGVYDQQTMQQIEEVTRQLIEAVNADGKLTKADAARTAAAPPELQRMAAQLRRILDEPKGMVVVVRMTVTPGGSGPTPCPGDQCNGSSVCFIWRNLCICICLPRIDLATRPAAATGQPSAGGADLVVVAAPPGVSDAEMQNLVQAGVSELRTMQESPSLVIKTKSVPPYTQQ
jgi:hypothetical protein